MELKNEKSEMFSNLLNFSIKAKPLDGSKQLIRDRPLKQFKPEDTLVPTGSGDAIGKFYPYAREHPKQAEKKQLSEEILKKRGNLKNILSPDVYANLMKLQAEKQRKEESIEEKMLKNIHTGLAKNANQEETYTSVNVKKEDDDQSFTKDIVDMAKQFKWKNMDKLEMDKVEWLKYVKPSESSGVDRSSQSVRFHLNGHLIQDIIKDEHNSNGDKDQGDVYKDSLRHHGDEPDKDGYTITELVTLAHSSFSQQKGIAVQTLTYVLRRSRQLEFVHHLAEPLVLSSLVRCGVVFLARWLLDDTNPGKLTHALQLIRELIQPAYSTCTTAAMRIWPQLELGMASHFNAVDCGTPDDELKDDQMLEVDVIRTLLWRTHLLDRLSRLLLQETLPLDNVDEMCLLDILIQVSRHSAAACSLLCIDNKALFQFLLRRGLNPTASPHVTVLFLRLLQNLICADHTLAAVITADSHIITRCYDLLFPDSDAALTPCFVITEVLFLLTHFLHRGVHLLPISEMLPGLLEHIYSSKTEPLLLTIQLQLARTALDLQIILPCQLPAISELLLSALERHETHLAAAIITLEPYSVSCSLPECMVTKLAHNVRKHGLLGYEHCNSGATLIRMDLPNLRDGSAPVAVMTANPSELDMEPHFLEVPHGDMALLRAVVSSLDLTNPEMQLYVTRLSLVPIQKLISPFLTHSLHLLMELDLLTALLFRLVQWPEAPPQLLEASYRLSVRLVSLLPLSLRIQQQSLLTDIIFNCDLVSKLISSPEDDFSPDSLAMLLSVFRKVIPSFDPSTTMATPALLEWYEEPFSYYNKHQEPNDVAALDLATMLLCLQFVDWLERGCCSVLKAPLDQGCRLERLFLVLAHADWSELLPSGSANLLVMRLLTQVLRPNPGRLSALATPLSVAVLTQFLATGYADPGLANAVLFPCLQRFPVTMRLRLWYDHLEDLRNVSTLPQESLFAPAGFLEPCERDPTILHHQWIALHQGHLAPDSLLQWVAVHHLNCLVFSSATANLAPAAIKIRELVCCAMLMLPDHPHVRLVTLYKHFDPVTNLPVLYDQLPPSRAAQLVSFRSTFN